MSMNPNQLQGKMLLSFTCLLDFQGKFYVNSHVQLRDSEELPNFDQCIKMHAACLSQVDEKARELIEQHTENEVEHKDALRFYDECIVKTIQGVEDREFIEALRTRDIHDASQDPLGGIAGVVEAARLVLVADKNDNSGEHIEAIRTLRLKLKEIGIEE